MNFFISLSPSLTCYLYYSFSIVNHSMFMKTGTKGGNEGNTGMKAIKSNEIAKILNFSTIYESI